MVTHDDIRGLFAAWSAALRTGDPDAVVALYASDAVLLPTLSDRVRRSPAEIRDYFVPLLQMGASATVDAATARVYGDVAIYSGTYTFRFASGSLREAPARFTFVYRRSGTGWSIVEHHSSLTPEGGAPAHPGERDAHAPGPGRHAEA